MRIALTAFFSTLIISLIAQPKYPVSSIPADMIEGMYAVVRESDTKFVIQSKNQSGYYIRKVITILNSKAKDMAEVVVRYDKLTKVETFKANVYDATGNLIKKLKAGDIIDQSSISGISLFEDGRVKYSDLSQTTYPYTVEYEIEVSMRFLFSMPNFSLYDDDEVSTQKEVYTIVYPKELKPRYRLFKINEPKIATMPDNKESMTWTFENIKPLKFERYSPKSDRVVPNIMVAPAQFEFDGYAGNMSTWEQYGRWQSSLNKGRDVLPEVTKQKVRELTTGLKTTEEKTRALYSFLQGKTRYVSIQLGIGGWQPFDATTVDQNGYGDCKALSNYMVALLKEVGIKGYYTKIMAGPNAPEITADFPDNQFNHIIVAIPNNKDTIWLECTSQTDPFGYLGKFTGDRKALMVTEDGGKLVHTLRYTAEQNVKTRYAEVELVRSGDAKAKVKTTYCGLQYETDGLNFILNNQYDEQKKWIQKNTSIPNFDVTSFAITDRKDKIPSAIVKTELDMRRFATVSGKRIFLTPNLMNRWTTIPEKLETRRTNVVLKLATTDVDTIHYRLPEGIYPEFMPQPVKISSRFGEYEATFTLDQDKLIYIRKLKLNKGEFPPESYNELVEFYRNLNKADNTKMVFLSKT